MEYRKHSIGKYSYGIDDAHCKDAAERDVTNFNFVDDVFVTHMNDKNHVNYKKIQAFLAHLALCHTVVAETKEGKVLYNASSPDELALVNGAKYFGYNFKGRDDDNNIEVNILG
jgi:phospholipid-transporting ATPase